jgi:hypothetical protein
VLTRLGKGPQAQRARRRKARVGAAAGRPQAGPAGRDVLRAPGPAPGTRSCVEVWGGRVLAWVNMVRVPSCHPLGWRSRTAIPPASML